MRVSEIPGISNMSTEERLRLAEELWDSVAADQDAIALTSEQKSELDKRLAAYEADRNPGRPAADVFRDIQGKL